MNSLKCTACGLVNFSTAAECKRCGGALRPEAAAGVRQSFVGTQAPPAGFGAQGPAASLPRPQAVYYEPSGEVTAAGLAAGVGGGLAAGVVLAFAYAYLIRYVPIVQINALCVVGYAAGLGAVVGLMTKLGKMRNNAVGLIIAVVVSAASYYFSWAVWLSILLSGGAESVSSISVALHPSAAWEVLQSINETGTWSLGRSRAPFSGTALWFVWAVEALTVLVVSPLVAWKLQTAAPFCEPCQTWCEEQRAVASLGPAHPEDVRQRCEAKDFPYLQAVGPRAEDAPEWYRLDLHRCPVCGKTNALSVQRERLKVDKKGNCSVDSKGLLKGLMLNDADVQQVRQLHSQPAQPQATA